WHAKESKSLCKATSSADVSEIIGSTESNDTTRDVSRLCAFLDDMKAPSARATAGSHPAIQRSVTGSPHTSLDYDTMHMGGNADHSQFWRQLTARIIERTARIAIIGLGYVGLPLALRFANSGFLIVGFDIDHEKSKMLASGESYIDHISPNQITELT